ncbi:AAA family ATPase [Nocardia takedensis]
MSDNLHRPITVAITGTHSTGKSTFLQHLAARLRRDRVEVAVVADLGLEAVRYGFPILDRHTWMSTLWIIARGMSAEAHAWIRADVVLIDRPVSDALGYYEAALEHRGEQPNVTRMCQLEDMVVGHLINYDLILRTVLDPTIPLDLSKPRGTDLGFRALADRHITKVAERLDIAHDLLLAHEQERAVIETMAFIQGRLDGDDRDTIQAEATP